METPLILPSTYDDAVAEEKGRLLAAQNLARDPERRKQFEVMFGADFARNRYPEAYSPSPFFKRVIDKLQFRPW